MIVRERGIQPDARTVRGAISEYMQAVSPRLERMYKAYTGHGKISERVRSKGLPNNRLTHAYPRYIATMAAGYLVGKPVGYAAQAGSEDALSVLLEAYAQCDMDSVDAELAMDASVYGKGVCVLYAGEDGMPRAAAVSPREAFVIYDDTVEHRPLFGVHWTPRFDVDGALNGVRASIYTPSEMIHCEGASVDSLNEVERAPHYFGDVPLVEFWNNESESGDFEPVLSLIDAYDVLMSDRVNDKQQFSDAILLLTGCTIENADTEDARSPAQRLLEERTLTLPDTDAKAEWLVKQADEAGTELLRSAINADIHKMSMVPDMTDEHFASNASGVAMRYKLLGLEQLTDIKERWFREGLRSRLKLFAHHLAVLGAQQVDARMVDITFTRSLPANEAELAGMVAQLDGLVPRETLIAQLPFVTDAQAAMQALREQQQEDAKRQAQAFGGLYADANDVELEKRGINPEQNRS